LAIDELLENSGDRQRFLAGCSETGLALATSLAGGASGLRRLPLLQTEDDWRCFAVRAEQLLQQTAPVLRIIWKNFQALKNQAEQDSSLRSDLSRLAEIFKKKLCPVAGRKLGKVGYKDSDSLKTFFEICHELGVPSEINLAEAWLDCLEDAKSWIDDRWVIWQDEGVPGRVEEFLRALNEFVPSFLEGPEKRQQLQQIHDAILERVTTEEDSLYESPKDEDDAEQRAQGYDGLRKRFEKLAAVPVWTEEQHKSLKQCAVQFREDAQSLLEGLEGMPSEQDYEGSGHERPASEDVSINELFRDL
jgi:hypothetical protein